MNVSKSRGHAGPSSGAAQSTTSTDDVVTILMVTMLLLITSHLALKAPLTPTQTCTISAPTTPVHMQQHLSILQSPSSAASTELSVCINDFLKVKGIDLFMAESALAALELTLNIINQVPVNELRNVMGAIEGCVRKFQLFCQEWVEHVEDKKHHGL